MRYMSRSLSVPGKNATALCGFVQDMIIPKLSPHSTVAFLTGTLKDVNRYRIAIAYSLASLPEHNSAE